VRQAGATPPVSFNAVCVITIRIATLDDTALRHGYADLAEARLHYVEAGDGPLVVLLHGYPEFWYGWRQQIPALAAAGFRVVAPDARGYNLSSKPPGVSAYAPRRLAADIRDLIAERGASRAFLAGHDWGAAVAWVAAMVHPEVVERLAILNVPHPRRMLEALRRPGRQMGRSWYIFFFQLPWLPERAVRAGNWWGLRRGFERGVVAARRGPRHHQLLPRLDAPVGVEWGVIATRRPRTRPGAHPGHLGRARPLLGRRPRRTPARRRPQPRTRGPAPGRLALGAARRARPRLRAADRLLPRLTRPRRGADSSL
jgi:pimeloyl-ACP methyl ester carboxylesterase